MLRTRLLNACREPAAGYHQLVERRLKFVLVWGFAVLLLCRMRRVQCASCGVKVEVELVCSDMWKPYLQLIAVHCTQALNILDRFYVVDKMNLALDEVRAAEARRMVQDGHKPVLKKSR